MSKLCTVSAGKPLITTCSVHVVISFAAGTLERLDRAQVGSVVTTGTLEAAVWNGFLHCMSVGAESAGSYLTSDVQLLEGICDDCGCCCRLPVDTVIRMISSYDSLSRSGYMYSMMWAAWTVQTTVFSSLADKSGVCNL